LLEFFRALARGDKAIRGRGVGTTEAAGMTNSSTTKVQQVSPTMANMQAIGEVMGGVLDLEGCFLKWLA